MGDSIEEEIIREEPRDYAFDAVSALRETISIAKRIPAQVSYNDTLDIIHDLDPKLYDRVVTLLTQRYMNDEVRYYTEMAEANSTPEQPVTPKDLIEKELEEVELAIQKKSGKATSLKRKKINLIEAISFFSPRKVSEHKILSRDFYLKGIRVPNALEIYKDESFVDYKLSGGKFLRLRLLHPDEDEKILGSDMIYEQYDFENELVRFVHLQFKVWGKNGVYFNQGNLKDQINKMCTNLCDIHYCESLGGKKNGDSFRFPFCSGFLRPTDKQLETDKELASSGIHLPICYIKKLFENNVKKITKAEAQSNGLSNSVFNELFVNGFVGSRWMPIEDLEGFYKERGIDDHINSIRVHAQEINVLTESERVLKAGK